MRTGRREGLLAALILAVPASLLLLPFASPAPLFYRDLSQNHLPVRILASSLRAAGEPTGWNPYLGGGVPLSANPNWLLRHPGWIGDRLLPPAAAIKAALALHGLMAAGFLAALLRRRGHSPAGAAAGAAAFAFGGAMLSLGTLPNLLTAAAWTVPALYFLERACRGGRWAILPAAGCGAASLMAADPAAAVALAAGAWLVARPAPGPDGAGPRASAPRQGRIALLVLLLAGCAALVQLLPAWHLLRRSERVAGLGAAEAGKWSLHPARLPELLIPGWLGDPTSFSPDRYWGAAWLETGLPFLPSIYIGLPAVGLALLGLATARRRERLAGGWLLGGGLLLAFGRHLPGFEAAVTALPGAGLYRYPEKMLVPAMLGLGLLVALGVDRIGEAPAGGAPRRLSVALLLSGLLLGLTGGLPAGRSLLGGAAGWLLGRDLTPGALDALGRGAVHAAALAAAAGLALLLGARERIGAPALRLLLAGLLCGDLALAAIGPGPEGTPLPGLRVNPTAPGAFLKTAPAPAALGPVAGEAGENREGWRTFRGERPDGFVFRRPDDSMAWGFLWDRVTLNRSWPAAFAEATAFDRPTDRLTPAAVARAAGIAAEGTLAQRLRLWSLDAVRFVTSYEPLDHPRLVLAGRLEGLSRPELLRYENRAALPRARLVARARPAPDGSEALAVALDPLLDPAREVVLESGDGPVPAPAGGPEGEAVEIAGEARWRMEGPERIVVEFEADRPGWLVLAENHDEDWRCELDGARVKSRRAYGFLTALEAPAGRHRLVMEYRPRSEAGGLAGLGLAAVLAAVASVVAGRRGGARRR